MYINNSLILNNHDVSYKLLSIGMIKLNGEQYIQVHCDRPDIEFSKLYAIDEIRYAIQKYIHLHSQYVMSEAKYGNFVPLDIIRKKNVPIARNS
jgi:hypothetical protein